MARHYSQIPNALKRLSLAVVAVLTIPFAAQAQKTAGEQALPEVKVQGETERADGPVDGYRATRSGTATKTDTPLKEVPASVTVVPAQLMKDQAMQSMGDVFRYVPGVLMHQGESNRDQIVIRGNSTTADFYVNGVRDDAQVYRDLYNLERVEVLKGAVGMIFGRGGAGGIVNRVTKKPVFGHVGEASLTLGSYDQKRGTFDFGNKLGDSAAFRLNGMAEGANNFVDGVDLRRWAVNPTLTYAFSAQTSLTLDYEHLHDGRVPNRGVPSLNGAPFDASTSTFFGSAAQSSAHSYVDGLSAVLDHDFGNGSQLRNTFRVTRYDKFYQNVYPGSAVNAGGNLTLSAYNNDNQRMNTFNQTDLTTKFSMGGFDHTLLTGMELGRQDSDSKRLTGFFGAATAITVPASNPTAVATSFRQNTTDANNKVSADVAALYAQDQIALTKEWKVIAGLRYDYFKVNFEDRRTLVPPTNLARTDIGYSPRAGLIWSPTARSTYYVSYSYAFLPSAEQLGLVPANVTLEPETAKNYEIGARWDVLPALTFSTSVFRLERNNVKSFNPLIPGTFVQSGEQRTEGVELALQGDVMRNWQVYGGYAYMNARVAKPFNSNTTATAVSLVPAGNKVGLVPEHTLSLWNKFNLGNGWGTAVGAIYQGASYTSFLNTVKLPAFARADAALYYSFPSGKTRVSLNVENIFNKKYWPTVDGDNNISVGAPVNARITVSTAF
ncbi:MAG: TonB-dependent receptor [Betaproteobacteria bacterium]|nr:TonB-dependent receptor [Betaproteobacteria bacterium]